MGDFFISAEELNRDMARGRRPVVIDVRRKPAFEASDRLLPGARWRDHGRVEDWVDEVASERSLVLYCVHGHNVSQLASARLRALGTPARTLSGGIEAWLAAGFPSVGKSPFAPADASAPSRWVTRLSPKIDRIACPWLIRRFIDPGAEILFVEPEWVLDVAAELGATAFDIKGAPLEHDGPLCTFDTMLAHFAVADPALVRLAAIVRGADTARLDLAPEAAGLLAVSLGVSAISHTDEEALQRGFAVYDALYGWLSFAAGETHNWPKAGGAA